MTLLCEITDWTAERKYLNALEVASKTVVPLIYGHHLYTFLYDFLSTSQHKINFIEILKPSDNEVHELFKSELKKYSVKLEDSEYAWDIGHWFPPQFQLEDMNLQLKISSMIKMAKFIEPDSIKNDDYLCYLPLSGGKLNDIIINSDLDLSIFTNGEIAGLKQKRFIKLEQTEIRSIYPKLASLIESCKRIFSEKFVEARNYRAPKYLTNFEGSYYEDLKIIEYDDRTKKLHFVGSDNYTAKEGFEYLLRNKNFREYNLEQPLEKLPSSDQPYVFTNFHHTFSQNKQHDLKEIITDHKLTDHIVIQGDNQKPIDYFNKYEKIPVPDEIEFRDIISGIFLSLLISNNKYRAVKRDRIIYPIVKHNLLRDLLSDALNPEVLSKTIGEFNSINEDDLLNNLSFWPVFLNKYKENYRELNKNKVIKAEVSVEKWHIIVKDKKYDVISEVKIHEDQDISGFLTYLLLLIRYTELKNSPMSVDDLRKAMFIFNDEDLPEYVDPENARTALSKIFNKAKKEHEWFDRFFNSYIKYESYEYTFYSQKLELVLKGFELAPDFYDNL